MNANTPRRGSIKRRRTSSATDLELEKNDNRVVLYIRASTSDQQHTLEAQAHEALAFATANGKVIVQTFTDSGVSGTKPFLERKEARKAAAYAKANGISTILAMKIDRALRNTMDMHKTLDHLLDNGISFRIANPDLDFKGAIGRLFATLLGALAEFELACRSERQISGYNSMRRKRIARSQNAPFGWDIGGEHPTEKSKSGKPYRLLVPNPAEQAVLREIIGQYKDKLTLQGIADILNQLDIRTKNAGKTYTRKGKTKIASGEWKPATVKSVIEHADLGDDITLPS